MWIFSLCIKMNCIVLKKYSINNNKKNQRAFTSSMKNNTTARPPDSIYCESHHHHHIQTCLAHYNTKAFPNVHHLFLSNDSVLSLAPAKTKISPLQLARCLPWLLQFLGCHSLLLPSICYQFYAWGGQDCPAWRALSPLFVPPLPSPRPALPLRRGSIISLVSYSANTLNLFWQ